MELMYWEEDVSGSPRAEYKSGCILLGEVRRIGGSWEVNEIINGHASTIAIRPDKESAKRTLADYLATTKRIT